MCLTALLVSHQINIFNELTLANVYMTNILLVIYTFHSTMSLSPTNNLCLALYLLHYI